MAAIIGDGGADESAKIDDGQSGRVQSDRTAPPHSPPLRSWFSTWTAFATGCAYAKAIFEFGRARWGVKGRADGASAKPISPLDPASCAKTIFGRLQGKHSLA